MSNLVESGAYKDLGNGTAVQVVAFAPGTVRPTTLLNAVTGTGAGSSVAGQSGWKTYHASGATTNGTGAVSVNVEGSMTGTSWDVIGTISLTLGTSAVSNGFTSNDRYALVRGNPTSISGTGAAVTLTMGA